MPGCPGVNGLLFVLVGFDARGDLCLGGLGSLDVADLGLLALESLVDGEEVLDLLSEVLGELFDVGDSLVHGVLGEDAEDLVVDIAGVDHLHDSDGPALGEGSGDDGFAADDEDVERVAVEGDGPGDESVVPGVSGGGGEDPVNGDEAGLLVHFVFHLASFADLDEGDELLGGNPVVGHCVDYARHGRWHCLVFFKDMVELPFRSEVIVSD